MTNTLGGQAAMHNSQPLHFSGSMTSVPRLVRSVMLAPPLRKARRRSWLATSFQKGQEVGPVVGQGGGGSTRCEGVHGGEDAPPVQGLDGVVSGESDVV